MMAAMRQRVADKLRDRGGVSILMALFAMLLASMVCIVVLSAALTTMKQAKDYHALEQCSLALQSAGELVRSEISKAGEVKFTWLSTDPVPYGDGACNSSALSGVLKQATKGYLTTNNEGSAKFTITTSQNGGATPEDYPPQVEAIIVFRNTPRPSGTISTLTSEGEGDWQLIVTLSADDGSGSKRDLFLKYSGANVRRSETDYYKVVGEETTDEVDYIEHTATFSWGVGVFSLSAEDVRAHA